MIDVIDCISLQNQFNEGFFSAIALSTPSIKYADFKFQIYVESNEIPDWCNNKVTASSICLTMPTVQNNEYNFFGMVLWFVSHFCNVTNRLQKFDVTIDQPSGFFWNWSFYIPESQGEVSCVYYFSLSNGRPFNDLDIIKGGEQLRVEDGSDGGIIKKIGVHLLYLDQHGNVTSFPAVVDDSYTPKSQPTKIDV